MKVMDIVSIGPLKEIKRKGGKPWAPYGAFGEMCPTRGGGRTWLLWHQRGVWGMSRPDFEDPRTDWAGDPVEILKLKPGTLAAKNRDTPYPLWDDDLGKLQVFSCGTPGPIPKPQPPNYGAIMVTQRAIVNPDLTVATVNENGVEKELDFANEMLLNPFDGEEHEQPFWRDGVGSEKGNVNWYGGHAEYSVVKSGTTLFLFYAAQSEGWRWVLCRARSEDGGKTWQRSPRTPVWTPLQERDGNHGGWGSGWAAIHPHVTVAPDGSFVMAMLEHGGGYTTSIGLWHSIDLGRSWRQLPGNPIYDRRHIGAPPDAKYPGWLFNSPWVFWLGPTRLLVGATCGGPPMWRVYWEGTRLMAGELEVSFTEKKSYAGVRAVTAGKVTRAGTTD